MRPQALYAEANAILDDAIALIEGRGETSALLTHGEDETQGFLERSAHFEPDIRKRAEGRIKIVPVGDAHLPFT
jgi:hypothetical protein